MKKLEFTGEYDVVQRNFDAIEQELGSLGVAAAWTALPLDAAWSNFGGGWQEAEYRKSNGVVYLRGLVTKSGGVPATNDVIGTLPSGFRPATRTAFAVVTGAGDAVGRVDVFANGQVQWLYGDVTETDFTHLSGIHFWTD